MPVFYYGHVATCFAIYRVQRSPTHTLCALSVENLSRALALLAFVYLVPNSSLSLNCSDCTAYGLQRLVGVPVHAHTHACVVVCVCAQCVSSCLCMFACALCMHSCNECMFVCPCGVCACTRAHVDNIW